MRFNWRKFGRYLAGAALGCVLVAIAALIVQFFGVVGVWTLAVVLLLGIFAAASVEDAP